MAKKTASTKKKSSLITEYKDLPISGDIGAVAVFPSGRDLLVVRVNNYKGKKSLDIRTFYVADDGTDDARWAPGKGVSVRAAIAGTLLATLEEKSTWLNDQLSPEE